MKNSNEAIHKRQLDILTLLRSSGSLSICKIASKMNVTTATIRRDLVEMEKTGTITKSFGKASYIFHNDDLKKIEPTNIEDEKELIRRKIAKYAAGMVNDGDVIYMNSSGTASLVLEYLGNKNVTVLTNNARAIERSIGANTQLIMTGGIVFGKKESLVGQYAIDSIEKVCATKCILGVSGISAIGGITSQILLETDINRAMLKYCIGSKIIVAEGSKIGTTRIFFSGNISDATHLITDSSAGKDALAAIEECGIKVISV
jgi:DeoR family fructose operon transcriptional repressor